MSDDLLDQVKRQTEAREFRKAIRRIKNQYTVERYALEQRGDTDATGRANRPDARIGGEGRADAGAV